MKLKSPITKFQTPNNPTATFFVIPVKTGIQDSLDLKQNTGYLLSQV